MLRPEIRKLTEFDYDEPLTFGRAVAWYKNVIQAGITPLTGEEVEYMNKQWGYLMEKIAEEQAVPVGWVAAQLAQLAQAEVAKEAAL